MEFPEITKDYEPYTYDTSSFSGKFNVGIHDEEMKRVATKIKQKEEFVNDRKPWETPYWWFSYLNRLDELTIHELYDMGLWNDQWIKYGDRNVSKEDFRVWKIFLKVIWRGPQACWKWLILRIFETFCSVCTGWAFLWTTQKTVENSCPLSLAYTACLLSNCTRYTLLFLLIFDYSSPYCTI